MDFRINQDNTAEVKRRTNEAIQRAFMIIGMKGSEYTANITPVDTGNLRGSIDYVVGDKMVTIGSNVKYAVFQELGTIKMQAANNGVGFLRPALKGSLKEFQGILEQELRNI